MKPLHRFVPFALLGVLLVSCGRPVGNAGGLEVGEAAPPIQAVGWFNGPPPTREERAGKVIVIDAWASNCGPCAAVAPEMVRLYNRYHPRGVLFLGMTYEQADAREQAEEFVKQHNLNWPNAYGAIESFKDYNVTGTPSMWVVGRDGRVVWNRDSDESVEDAIDRALTAEEPSEKAEQ